MIKQQGKISVSIFINVEKSTVKKINHAAFEPKTYSTEEQFTFSAVKKQEVESIIGAMAVYKAPGYNKITLQVIKDSCPLLQLS